MTTTRKPCWSSCSTVWLPMYSVLSRASRVASPSRKSHAASLSRPSRAVPRRVTVEADSCRPQSPTQTPPPIADAVAAAASSSLGQDFASNSYEYFFRRVEVRFYFRAVAGRGRPNSGGIFTGPTQPNRFLWPEPILSRVEFFQSERLSFRPGPAQPIQALAVHRMPLFHGRRGCPAPTPRLLATA
jgi:hypothetical protein